MARRDMLRPRACRQYTCGACPCLCMLSRSACVFMCVVQDEDNPFDLCLFSFGSVAAADTAACILPLEPATPRLLLSGLAHTQAGEGASSDPQQGEDQHEAGDVPPAVVALSQAAAARKLAAINARLAAYEADHIWDEDGTLADFKCLRTAEPPASTSSSAAAPATATGSAPAAPASVPGSLAGGRPSSPPRSVHAPHSISASESHTCACTC